MDDRESLLRCTLTFYNIFFGMLGFVLITLGVVTKYYLMSIDKILGVNFEVIAIIAIVAGGIVFIIAFLGCCGAIKKNKRVLFIYSSIMLLLVATKVALGTLLIAKRDDIVAEMTWLITNAFNNNHGAFYIFEEQFKCCGILILPSNWNEVKYSNTCCANPPCIDRSMLYSSCNEVFHGFIMNHSLPIAIVTLVLAAVELVVALYGLCLSNYLATQELITNHEALWRMQNLYGTEEESPRNLEDRVHMTSYNLCH